MPTATVRKPTNSRTATKSRNPPTANRNPKSRKYVYFFGNGKADGNRHMKDLLGGKGSGLAEMTNAGLPVPPGFTISTAVCNIYYQQKGKIPAPIDREIAEHVKKLEKAAGAELGSAENPLLVSVRSGAKFSMPGMMDTILNLGLNDKAVEGLNRRTQEYRRIYDIPDHIGTAVNVQMMVFGNTGDRSATGVGFTRNPATGQKEFYGEFLINAQGEDVVAGIRTPQPIKELERVMPKAYKQLRDITTRLERNYKDIQDFEFTIQDETLYMLQTRSGKRTGYAAVVIATDFVKEKLVTPKEAILLVDPEALSQLLAPGFDPKEWKSHDTVTRGLPASPGAACGKAVFSSETAVEWSNKGQPVILVRRETVPDDIHGMWVSQGILTATGGMTSHAAVVGRQMGKPSIVGAGELRIDEHGKSFTVKGKTVKEGDFVAFDGLTGEVKIAKVASQPSEILQVVAGKMKPADSPIYQRFNTLLSWTDKFRRLGVRANAEQH